MKAIPTIMKYMSTCPQTIGADQTIQKASEMMRENGIRHLPVLDGGKLSGIISDRDIKFYLSLDGANASKDLIKQIVDQDVYTVKPDSLMSDVVLHMAETKQGSALVMDNHKVVGIFTSIDALRAFSELLETRLK